MFGFVKKWLGKKGDPVVAAPTPSSAQTPPAAPATPVAATPNQAHARGVSKGPSAVEPPLLRSASPPPPPSTDPGPAEDGSREIHVSLLGVVDLLPSDLKPVKAVGDVASVQISIPLRLILGQLAQGCARIPFGELKKLAPSGFFTAASDKDAKLIDLPLREVLPQLGQGSFSRRGQQQMTYVPAEVTNVFAARGTPVAPTNKPPANAVSVPVSAPPPPSAPSARSTSTSAVPVAARAVGGPTTQFKKPPLSAPQLPSEPLVKPAKPADMARSSAPSVPGAPPPLPQKPPTPPTGKAAPSAPAQTFAPPASPGKPEAPAKPIAAPSLLAAMQGGLPAAPKGTAPAKQPLPGPVSQPAAQRTSAGASALSPIAMRMKAPEPSASPEEQGSPATTSSDQQSSVSAGAPEAVFAVALGQVSSSWPSEIQTEIARWGIADYALMLPLGGIERGMRQGRVQYPWGELLRQITPALPSSAQSAHPGVVLDLPLSVVAPLFLTARQKESAVARTRSQFDASIPDLFHGAAPTAPSSSPQATATGKPGAPVSSAKPVAAPTGPAPAASTPTVVQARSAAAAAPPVTKPAAGGRPTVSAPVPAPAAPEPGDASSSGEVLGLPLAMVDESWSDVLKSEIARLNVSGLKLNIPYDEVNKGLKSGKLEYSWKQLRVWLHPVVPETLGAEHSEKLLTLPLKVVAPMFLGHFKPGRSSKKAPVNAEIPDLFSGGSVSTIDNSPASQPPASSSEGAHPSAPSASAGTTGTEPAGTPSAASYSTTQFFRKPPADLGELFGQPGRSNWTPQEVVQGTTRVRGVGGAVIAMHDGLLVAAHLPSPWRPEATAAFLPQIYSRLNQYLKELEAGDLNSVILNTPSGTLFVFSTGVIYFAVVSKVGEEISLPAIQLIVKELSRHSK